MLAPAARGRGLGGAVLAQLVALARSAGARGLIARFDPGDERARRLVEGQGFVSRGEVADVLAGLRWRRSALYVLEPV